MYLDLLAYLDFPPGYRSLNYALVYLQTERDIERYRSSRRSLYFDIVNIAWVNIYGCFYS